MSTIQFLVEWAVRSSLLILAGAVVLLVLRVKDSSIRLAAWVALLCGSLALPLMSVVVPAVRVPVVREVIHPVEATVAVFYDVPGPVGSARQVVAAARPPFDWARAGLVLYFAIALALILRVGIGLAMSRRLLRASRDTGEPGIRESDDLESPATLGIWRSAIVLPFDWTAWDEAKLAAVLAHERSHIARYDPAVQLLSAVHRAVLWFSPASWFLHSHIVRVAEEASDDAAVAVTRDRISYAEILLEFMRRGVCEAGVPMARYGKADKRIYRILDAASLSRGVTRWSVVAILSLGAPLAYLAASVTPRDIPVRAVAAVQRAIAAPPAVEKTVDETPRLIAQAAPPPKAQVAVADARPKFDVASIKPCDPDYVPSGGRGRAGGGGGGGTGIFRLNCITVSRLINDAYIRFADGQNRSPMLSILTKVEGGPAWLNTDQYTIEAEGDESAEISMMAGPMMQRLLEERFQLKVHRETREGLVYELTLPKGSSRSLAAKGTPCVAADFADLPIPFRSRPGDDRPCNMIWNARKGTSMVLTARGLSMEQLTQSLTGATGKLVIDKTGITGNVDLDLVYAPNENAPGPAVTMSADGAPVAADPVGPSIFTALERIGLKLEPAKGAREYLVIDSVSRPSAN